MPSPSDHARMIVELLQPCGTDLARRWLAALLVVPKEERESVVQAIETRVVSLYASNPADDEPVSAQRSSKPETEESNAHERPKAVAIGSRSSAGPKSASIGSGDRARAKKRPATRK